jgi:hypothetical protein
MTLQQMRVGDVVIAVGTLDPSTNTLYAVNIIVTSGSTSQASLGVTYISGIVQAIDVNRATITVVRPDKVSQTIAFEPTTLFTRTGDGSVKPGDLKVGDNIRGPGRMIHGVFVSARLTVLKPQPPDISSTGESPLNPAKPQHNGADGLARQ